MTSPFRSRRKPRRWGQARTESARLCFDRITSLTPNGTTMRSNPEAIRTPSIISFPYSSSTTENPFESVLTSNNSPLLSLLQNRKGRIVESWFRLKKRFEPFTLTPTQHEEPCHAMRPRFDGNRLRSTCCECFYYSCFHPQRKPFVHR